MLKGAASRRLNLYQPKKQSNCLTHIRDAAHSEMFATETQELLFSFGSVTAKSVRFSTVTTLRFE